MDRLLTPSETAEKLGVTTKTLGRWANSGKIKYIKTLGGHRRYYESAVREALAAG